MLFFYKYYPKKLSIIYFKASIHINELCQEINYPFLKCDGYCPSKTFFYGNNEINKFSCCSLDKILMKKMNIFCKRKLKPYEIKNAYALHLKDPELFDSFQSSFTELSWQFNKSAHFMGYYTLNVYYNATCVCQESL